MKIRLQKQKNDTTLSKQSEWGISPLPSSGERDGAVERVIKNLVEYDKRGRRLVEEAEEERRSVSLHSLLSEFPEQEGTLRRRGRLLYHGDEDEDVRNAVCMEVVAASMKQIAGLLGMEERAADARELRESVMGMGKQGEKTTVMEMIPEENAEEGEGEATGNMWNTGCGKD